MASPLEQTQAEEGLLEFSYEDHAQCKWGTTTLEFGSEKKFSGRKMKRGNPIPGPLRSLNITSLEFFL
ncbi:hypothetical protein TNCV_1847061 [Trichonephila clavipes]|nr:hypothetical protein TNCV_1847061 [Trichonephila clavipes]